MRSARLALVPAVLLTAACFQGQRVVKINADGSGTIVDTVKMGEQAKSMMAAMEEMDKSSPAEKKTKKEAKFKERATAMGLTFVSHEATPDGGSRTTYTFKDVTTIKITGTPTMENEKSESSESPLAFKFAKSGNNSVLTVIHPKPKVDASPKAKKEPPKPEEIQQALAMMKGMMAGLKMSLQVQPAGKLVKTSSPYVTGNTVTLMEMDFDQLDEASLKKLAAADKDGPPPMDLLKSLKGVKATDGEVTIEFSK
ncbi:MAG TPA: hypothetical protein VF310_04065 [Vicinamibacteria bacterium]